MSTPTPPGPTLGPCTAWITGEDVAARTRPENADTALLATVAEEAGLALFEISGRMFTGLCERTVRPSSQACGCFGAAAGMGAWYWTSLPIGSWGWGWLSECGDRIGCQPMSRWKLSGYPVREVTQVLIDGDVVDPTGYRLDDWRYLTRMDDPGPPVVRRYWPGCQNMSLDSDQPGTFEVSYRCGIDPPQLGKDAACQLAHQLYLSLTHKANKLPAGTTKVQRQGVSIERGILVNWLDRSKPTGLAVLDTFLALPQVTQGGRRPAVWSPDVQRYGRPVGAS